ncbi:hypothetical protein BDQ94DRAFT_146999 [Aspergillus welwitschiae]|uniref:Uncharacterized protein n=1 Tax=Aspergillus welwitschiae TaxID=1341132 RepID=A0A3F3PXE1_9EURO|nr:hypothetical protein BDQ94DRAFT_146999 [Aspergillus welwitschiae]RDH31573.1 hypothetical protein BDQ94DRAFT_146999 [Aspergillus welwitschiae]
MHLRLVGSVALHGWRQRYPQSLISCTPYAFIGFCVGLCDPAVGNSLPHVFRPDGCSATWVVVHVDGWSRFVCFWFVPYLSCAI